uniref:Thioredoxin domain-containing protein n=1 Tax=Brassica campestris TaxID=3711 RepID=M4CR10_BRACM
MTNLTHSLLFFSCSLSLLIRVAIAGSRPAHGPAYSNPSAFSPEAYDFFHPKSSLPDNNPPRNSHSLPFLSPSPSPSKASNVEADTQGSKVSSDERISESRREEGRGETVGIVIGISFTALLLMGIYFVIKKRLANLTRTITVALKWRSAFSSASSPSQLFSFSPSFAASSSDVDDEDFSFLEDLNDEGPGEPLTSPVSLSQTNSTEEKPEDPEAYDDVEYGDFSDLGFTDLVRKIHIFRPNISLIGGRQRAVLRLKGDGVGLAKVDATEENELTHQYSVQGVPTIILFFVDGEHKPYTGGRTK